MWIERIVAVAADALARYVSKVPAASAAWLADPVGHANDIIKTVFDSSVEAIYNDMETHWPGPAPADAVTATASLDDGKLVVGDGGTKKVKTGPAPSDFATAGHTHTTLPTTDEKASLAGTSGTPPSGTNKLVDNADPRNTNSRSPTAHQASHVTGADQIPSFSAGNRGLVVAPDAGGGDAGKFLRGDATWASAGSDPNAITSDSTVDDTKLIIGDGGSRKVKTGPAVGDFATAGHTHATLPTSDQKDALAGTSGSPSAANKYVTNADSRNSDARSPTGPAGGDLSGTYPNPGVGLINGVAAATVQAGAAAGLTAVQPAAITNMITADNVGADNEIVLYDGAGRKIKKSGKLVTDFANASHTHAQADVTDLVTDLAAKAAKSLWTGKGSILAATAASTPSAITPAFPANEGHVLVARTAESSGWALESAPAPATGVTAASTLTDLYLIKGDGGDRGVQTGPALTSTGGTAGDSGKVVTLDAVGGIPSASMIQAYKIDNPIDLVPTSPDAMDDEFAGDGSLDGKWLTLTGSGSAITIARSSSLCRIVAPVGATLQGRYQTGIPSPTGDWAFTLALKQWRLASYVLYSCPIGLYVWENSGSNRNYGIYLQDMGPSGPYVIHLQVGYYINWAWSSNPYADYYHSGCRESAYAPLYLRISRVSGNLVFAYSNTGDASAWRTVYTVACPWTPDANTAIGIVVPWAGAEAFNMIKWFRKTG